MGCTHPSLRCGSQTVRGMRRHKPRAGGFGSSLAMAFSMIDAPDHFAIRIGPAVGFGIAFLAMTPS